MGNVPQYMPAGDDTGHPWFDATPWEKWYAWHPVRLTRTKKLVWMKGIFRRINMTRTSYDDYHKTEYGDVFDVLRL
jgi:hypothetical protein